MASWTATTQLKEAGRTRLAVLWPGALTVGLILLIDGAFQRAGPESLPLRWIRSAAQHPVRVWLAISLISWALRPATVAPAPSPPCETGKIDPHGI